MQPDSNEPAVLPPGWVRRFFDRADLKASFAELSGCGHFHAETMRGLIRSIEVRTRAAERHFRAALRFADRAPKTIPNLVRQVLLNAFWIENKALDGTLGSVRLDGPLEFPEFPPSVVRDYPEIKLVNNVRLSVEGTMCLHLGEWERSSDLFREIVARAQGETEDVLALTYLGIASAEYNLGREEVARRNLENAGLSIQVGGTVLSRVRVASNLVGLYRCLGETEMARDWRRFLSRLDCPDATKAAFLKRSKILRDRWVKRPVMLFL